MNFFAAVLAVALHAAVVAGAVVRCDGAQAQPPVPAPAPPSDGVVNVRLLPSNDVGDGTAPCPRAYRGIGIKHAGSMVLDVAHGGPAHRAGVLVGDWVINMDEFKQDRYVTGHQVTVRVERDGRVLALPITIGRICYD